MSVYARVHADTYRDSVFLMQLSARLTALPGIDRVSILMGTQANKALFAQAGLLVDPIRAAGPNDLCIAVLYGPPAREASIAEAVEAVLHEGQETSPAPADSASRPRSLRAACAMPTGERCLAVISVPGPFAAAEAGQALHLGMNVFLFSNGVSLEDEVTCKRLAEGLGLLVMGPDAGTALIGGMPLGFVNVWPPGPVGIVAASGTGAQEVACQVARAGSGISQIVAAGGRDLLDAVGGITFRAGMRRLAADPSTEVVVLISKPPGPACLRALAAELATLEKPCAALFQRPPGTARPVSLEGLPAHVILAGDTDEAARAALARRPVGAGRLAPEDHRRAREQACSLQPGRTWIRGLFSGGTLAKQAAALIPGCAEATPPSSALADALGGALDALSPPGHRVVDLGDEVFTLSRPHPILDPTLRARTLRAVAARPDTAVVLFDVVLATAGHPDPAGVLAEAVRQAPGPCYVASITGTEDDPQRYSAQSAALGAAGVWVGETGPEAARLAAAIASQLVR